MKDNAVKQAIKSVFFPDGAVRRIALGPCAGMKYRVSKMTGLSPWYSGAEKHMHGAFRQLVNTGDTVMDVGANWGLHTLYLSRLVGPTGAVIAVEPFGPVAAELEWHIQTNKCTNTKVYRLALSSEDGFAEFTPGDRASKGHLTSLSNEEDVDVAQAHSKSRVQTKRLDSLVKELSLTKLKLIKLDVEGAESLILEGARETMRKFRPILVIELHTSQQDVKVAKLVCDEHYTLRRLSHGPPIRKLDRGWPEQDGVWGTILGEHNGLD